jgi:predicted dehydrogenase
MINVGIVGLGWWGKKLAQSIGESALLRVVRGVETNPDATAGFADTCGFPISADYASVLEDPSVDAVLLATPHSLHGEQIERAAAAKKHVFCEKPLALTRAGAERSVRLMMSQGLVLGIGHERRWEPAVAQMMEEARSGRLGTLLQMEANSSHDKFAALAGDSWRLSNAEAPAGGMTATAIHLFDIATALFGEGETAYASNATLASNIPNGDSSCALVRYRNGCTAYVSAILATPFISRIALFGSEGWIEIRDKAHLEAFEGSWLTRCAKGGRPVIADVAVARPVLANLEAFARAVEGANPYPIASSEMIANAAIMEAIFRSAKEGTAQKVPANGGRL